MNIIIDYVLNLIQNIIEFKLRSEVMGIDNLLLFLKPIIQKEHLSSFEGKKVGIDVSPWLYKACYNYVQSLETIEGEVKISCSNYLLLMLDLLEYYHIEPFFVFDGRSLPLKAETITKRKNIREDNKNKSSAMVEKQSQEQAKKYLARAITITEDIVKEAMGIFKKKNVKFIVAPYQSDSQLAKLVFLGLVDLIVTEDSDLLVYGVDIICKLTEEGECDYVSLSNLEGSKISSQPIKQFVQMEKQSKILACILAGCDYLPSIKGIGLKKAIKYMEQNKNIYDLVSQLRSQKQFQNKIPEDYEIKAMQCMLIFKYATVYNPIHHRLQSLNAFTEEIEGSENIVGQKYNEYIELSVFSGETSARNLQSREIPSVQITAHTQIDTIKLKELETKQKIKKQQIDLLKQADEDEQERNMIEAYFDLEKRQNHHRNIEEERKTFRLNNLIVGLVKKLLQKDGSEISHEFLLSFI